MTKNYKLKDICPSCARNLENALKKINGVDDAKVNIMTEKLTLTLADNTSAEIFKEIKKTCMRIEPDCVLSIE